MYYYLLHLLLYFSRRSPRVVETAAGELRRMNDWRDRSHDLARRTYLPFWAKTGR